MKISTKLTLIGIATTVSLTTAGAITWWSHDRTKSALDAANTHSHRIDLCHHMSDSCSQVELVVADSINDRAHGRPSGERSAQLDNAIAQLNSGARSLGAYVETDDETRKIERIATALPLATEAVNVRLMELLETRGSLREVTRQEFVAFRDHLDELRHAVEEALNTIESAVRKRLENAPDPKQLTTAIDRTGRVRASHLELMLAVKEAIADRKQVERFENHLQRISDALKNVRAQSESVVAISETDAENRLLEQITEAGDRIAHAIQADLTQHVETDWEHTRTMNAAFAQARQDLDTHSNAVNDQLNKIEAWARHRLAQSDRQNLLDAVDLVSRLRMAHLEMTLAATEALIAPPPSEHPPR